MAEHHFGSHSAAAVVFFILYLAVTIPVTYLLFTKRGVAIAFGIVSYDNTDLLIAYLVLGIEGYFSLVLVGTYALVDWEVAFLGNSLLEPRHDPPIAWWRRAFVPGPENGGWLPHGHNLLIAANALSVTGGSMMSNAMDIEDEDDLKAVSTGKTLRCAGAALMLALAQCYSLASFIDLRKYPKSLYIILCAAAWPFFTVRGVFGILQIYVSSFNYLSLDAYTSEGLSQQFLLAEYLMGVTMEWVCCALFVSLYWCHLPAVESKTTDETTSANAKVFDEPVKQ